MENPDITRLSILAWVLKNNIVNEKGEKLEWWDRKFLLDILTDWSQEIVIKKCSQVGGSVIFNIKVLFAIENFGWNIIYTFPTDSDVSEFVSSKTNKIIQANPQVFSGLNTDNIERKEINGRFLFFKGTVSKTAAIMTSSDVNVHDEADRSSQPMLETYKSRTKASKFKGRWLFSNPTTEKGAIDNAWKDSDQKEWCIACPKCENELPLVWPESINQVKKHRQCSSCKAEITNDQLRGGKWVAQNPDARISGYHISHLMCPWISAEEIIRDSQGDQEYFHNFVLGEPYNPGDLKINKGTILDNWTPKDLQTKQWYLGVDVGNIKHYVLGSEKGVIKVGKFSKWSELDDILAMYKPIMVIDAMPENTMSKHFVENYRNAFMCYLNRDKDNKILIKWGENEQQGVIHADRNRAIDALINDIVNAKILFGVPSDGELREYIKHWETLRRVKETNTLGIERYVWDSTTGQDHFVFATLFFWIALQAAGNGKVFAEATGNNRRTLIGRDNVVGDVQEMLLEGDNW